MAISVLLSFIASFGQIKNTTTESVKIYGNCGMCKNTIEEAGNIKKVAQVTWDKDTKMATLIYDASKTNASEILKRIALAGYDSDQFLAPDAVYAKLPGCCQYDRIHKSEMAKSEVMEDHTSHNHNEIAVEADQLKAVFDNYFLLKDALVKSDSYLAAAHAKTLLVSIKAVAMDKLTTEAHMVWMEIMKDLIADTARIEKANDISFQREYFMVLSESMYPLFKVSEQESPIYYQYCPMADGGKGAHWLSQEKAIKNPYYGSQMLTCGKTVETIE